MKYLILISFLFLTILGKGQTIRVPWYEIEPAPDSGYIARSTSVDGDGAWYLPTYREGDTIAVWNPNTRKLEFRTKASILSGIPSGSGTSGTLTKWTGTNTIGDAAITENATRLSASLPFRLANIPTVSLPGVPQSGDVVYNTTTNNFWGYYASSWRPISLWEISGSNIYYTNGTAAVGTTGGSAMFTVRETSTSNLFRMETSAGVLGMSFRSDGLFQLGSRGMTIAPITGAYNAVNISGNTLSFFPANNSNTTTLGSFAFVDYGYSTYSANTKTVRIAHYPGNPFAQASGAQTYTALEVAPSINQTGTATGTITGIDYTPTLTAILGTHYGILIRPTAAKSGFGTGTPSATVDIVGDLEVSTLTGDAQTIAGWTTANKATKITYESIIDSLIANGLVSTNIYTADGTATGNRKYSANNTTLTFDNLAGLTFSGEGTVTIEDTLGAATLNITRDNGSVTSSGATIASIVGRTRRAGDVVSDITRIDMIYGGDATDQYGIMDLGVRGQSGYGAQNVRLFAASGYQEKRAVLGYLATNYPGAWSTDAVVTLSGRSTVENTLAIHDEGNEVFRVEYDGETYIQDFAHVGGAFFTQTVIDTVTNTASETSLINTGVGSVTLPTDFLEPGRTIICEGLGWWSNNSVTPSLQFRQDIGAVTVGDTGGGSMPDLSGGQEFWEYKVTMTCQTAGASGTVMTQGVWTWQYADFTDGRKLSFSNTATATVNTTIANTLDFTVQMGGADANAFVVMTNFVCEAKN